jgi:hypothetical protein
MRYNDNIEASQFERKMLQLGKSSVSELKKVISGEPPRCVKDYIQIVNNVARNLNPIGALPGTSYIKLMFASIKSEAMNIQKQVPETRNTLFTSYVKDMLSTLKEYNAHVHKNPLSLR